MRVDKNNLSEALAEIIEAVAKGHVVTYQVDGAE